MVPCLNFLKHVVTEKLLAPITSATQFVPDCEEGDPTLENVNSPTSEEERPDCWTEKKPIPRAAHIIKTSGRLRILVQKSLQTLTS